MKKVRTMTAVASNRIWTRKENLKSALHMQNQRQVPSIFGLVQNPDDSVMKGKRYVPPVITVFFLILLHLVFSALLLNPLSRKFNISPSHSDFWPKSKGAEARLVCLLGDSSHEIWSLMQSALF